MMLDSLRDRMLFLKSNPTYTKHGLYDPGTVGDFAKEAKALKAAGYATDPNYVKALQDVWSGRTMRRAIAAAQKAGCGAHLPVIEVFLKDGAKAPMPATKVKVDFAGRSHDVETDHDGGMAIRIPPGSCGAIAIKVCHALTKEWIEVGSISIPNPIRSLTSTLLAPTITIPTSTRLHDKPPAAKPPVATMPAAGKALEKKASDANGALYKVAKGDTLGKIAAKHGMRYKTIADLNGIHSPYIIREGQLLRMPATHASATPAHHGSHQAAPVGAKPALLWKPRSTPCITAMPRISRTPT
jgi:LysM repeat protein